MFVFTTTDVDLTGGPSSTGRANRIMGFHVQGGAAAATVLLRNGGSSGAIFIPIEVGANTSVHCSFTRPVLFPKGLYIDTDSNVENGSVQPG